MFRRRNQMDRPPRHSRTGAPVGELVVDRQAAAAKLRPGVGVTNCRCGATFLHTVAAGTCPVCGR
jgi:hypothetical protein